MPTPGENEVELLQQNPLGKEPPDLPPNPYPSAPEPEPEPLENFGSDSQQNLPPNPYPSALGIKGKISHILVPLTQFPI